MLHILYSIIHNRHFWQRIKISELSELYVSMTLKSLALSLIAVFVPVYLYQLGFSVPEIALYYVGYFLFRILLNFISGELTARYGPKHILAYSYVFLLLFLAMLLTMPTYFWPLWALGFAHAAFNSLFFIPYHVDFSKVQDIKHTGKQLSTMNILIRSAAALGPFVGGAIASLYGIRATLTLAVILVIVAILPLMMTREIIKIRKRPNYRTFNFLSQARNMLAYSSVAVERQVGLTVWPLFMAVVIFTSDKVYADVGLVTSVSIATSLIMARVYGHLVDNHNGKYLLNTTSIFMTVVHIFRMAVNSFTGVLAINISTELAETGNIIALTKGYYGEADASEERVAYVTISESLIAFVRAVFWLVVFVAVVTYGNKTGLLLSFAVGALASLGILSQKFKTFTK